MEISKASLLFLALADDYTVVLTLCNFLEMNIHNLCTCFDKICTKNKFIMFYYKKVKIDTVDSNIKNYF